MLMSYQACLVLDSTTSSCFNNSAPLRGSDDLTGVSTESETNRKDRITRVSDCARWFNRCDISNNILADIPKLLSLPVIQCNLAGCYSGAICIILPCLCCQAGLYSTIYGGLGSSSWGLQEQLCLVCHWEKEGRNLGMVVATKLCRYCTRVDCIHCDS